MVAHIGVMLLMIVTGVLIWLPVRNYHQDLRLRDGFLVAGIHLKSVQAFGCVGFGGQFFQGPVDGSPGAAPDGNIGAGPQKRAGHGRADNPGAAGDDGGMAFQIEQVVLQAGHSALRF
mgnify:CR=1 FL=1